MKYWFKTVKIGVKYRSKHLVYKDIFINYLIFK